MKNKLLEQLGFLVVCFCLVMFTGCNTLSEEDSKLREQEENIKKTDLLKLEPGRFSIYKSESIVGYHYFIFKDNVTDREYLYYDKTMTELKPKDVKDKGE